MTTEKTPTDAGLREKKVVDKENISRGAHLHTVRSAVVYEGR